MSKNGRGPRIKVELWRDGEVVRRWGPQRDVGLRLIGAIGKRMGIEGDVAYLRVSYGKQEDVEGKVVDFINEGRYVSPDELRQAYRAFVEEAA